MVAFAGTALPTASLQVGVTHVNDWEPWSQHQDSVARAVALMKQGVITWQNQGVVGGGGMWLPSPGIVADARKGGKGGKLFFNICCRMLNCYSRRCMGRFT